MWGTNTEVVVGHAGRMLTASCPAGPAFEGGLIKYGMPGCDGAIESIRLIDGRFEIETIGGVEPQQTIQNIDAWTEICGGFSKTG